MTEPHKLTGGLKALADELGIDQARVDAESLDGPVYQSHADFLRQNVDYREHSQRFGGPWDCEGMLRFTEQSPRAAIWTVMCDACGFELGFPSRAIPVDELHRIRAERAHLPLVFLNKDYQRTKETEGPRKILRQWLRSPDLPTPALWGPTGTGKSHLATLMAGQLLKLGHDVAFWTMAELLDEMREEMREGSEAIWRRARNVQILFLDDLGGENDTDWRGERLYQLVDKRYQNEAPIFITTNFAPHHWQQEFGGRTSSRLMEMTQGLRLEIRGRDWRQGSLAA